MTFTNVEDFRVVARSKLPRSIFEYGDGGSYDEVTLRANRNDLERLRLGQRVMVDMSHRSMKTRIVGGDVNLPLVIAPTGLGGLFHADGEIHGTRAAEKAGIPFCLSTMSICSIEDVRAAVKTPFWFQLYVMRDRGFTRSLVERAVAAKCSALVLTVDLQVGGQRHRDIKNGLSISPRLTFSNVFDIASKPRWTLGVLAGRRRSFGNLEVAPSGEEGLASLAKWVGGQFDPSLTWDDVDWVRSIGRGSLSLKDCWTNAMREKRWRAEPMPSSSRITAAVNWMARVRRSRLCRRSSMRVLFDGGIRSGQDVLKALALGAKACMIGRAYLYALASGGQKRVEEMLDILGKELDTSMALTGVHDVKTVSPETLLRRSDGTLVGHYH
jgi:L-lactate dehydrogenase (cytochrome)